MNVIALKAVGYGDTDNSIDWPDGWADADLDVEPAPQRGLRSRLISRAQLADLPQPEPLIEGTLDKNTVALLSGAWGTKKTFTAISMGASVATGSPWLGRSARRGRVLYISAEGTSGMHQRFTAWETAWRQQIIDLDVLTAPVNLFDRAARIELRAMCADRHYSLVVVDTLARCMVGAEENSAKDMGVVVDALEQLREVTTGGTILVVHHTGKDGITTRGSSALEAAVDTVYQTASGDDGYIRLTRTKRKNGPTEDAQLLKLLPIDDSCVIEVANLSTLTMDMSSRANKLLSRFVSTFGQTGGSQAELRRVADMPDATFHRAVKDLLTSGALINTGTDQRKFFKPGVTP